MPQPEVSVVVASHERPTRLATLLDALAAQTLPRERWELVVVHTYDPATAARVLEGHELARAGSLRQIAVAPSDAGPALQRNRGWRAACAPLIAFTDDDCRPAPDWLERLAGAARRHPGAIVQGATRPDPLESDLLAARHVRTLHVDPPGRFTQTCNILYERALLERVGGFDELPKTGEDIDLARRAIKAGAPLAAEPGALVYHAVEALSMREKMRSNRKWQHLAYVVGRHPELRRQCPMRVWWKLEHMYAVAALAALVGAPRRPWLLAGLLPFARLMQPRLDVVPPGRYGEMACRLGEWWLVELVEVGTFARGSVRYRTLLL